MLLISSCELLQESNVALIEKLNIIDSILQHGYALNAHTKGEAADLRGVVAVALDRLKDIGINHAASQQLDPAAQLTQTATFTTAFEAGDLHVCAGLSEWEKRRIETGLHVRAEERFHGVIERAFQITKGDVGIHGQTFHLVEDRRVGRVCSIGSVYFARDHYPDGRRLVQHGPDLHRRGMGAQQEPFALLFLLLAGNK